MINEDIYFPEQEQTAAAAIEAMFAEVEPRQSREAYVYGTRSLTTFRYEHTAFDSGGVKPQGASSPSEMSPDAAATGLILAVGRWLAQQPTPVDRRRLVWRIKPEICERKRGLSTKYAAYCRLTLALTGDTLEFPEDDGAD